MDQKANTFLEENPIGRLMRKYAVPCVISLLVAALYNIVDQLFIANASYLGSYGNAANTVVFPITVIALAIAVMIGDGCCAFVSISLGAGRKEDAHRSIGSAVLLCIISGLVLTALYLIFQEPILTLFGGRVNEETFSHAREYFFWITIGIPFYMFGHAHESHHPLGRQPPLRYGFHSDRCGSQYHSGPCIHFCIQMGHDGGGSGYRAGSGSDSGFVNLVVVQFVSLGYQFPQVRLPKAK